MVGNKALIASALLASGAMLVGGWSMTSAAHKSATTARSGATASSGSNGVIADGISEEPTVLNPILGGTPVSFSTMVDQTMFRNLLTLTPSGKLEPDLATTVPTFKNGGISKNGLDYTFQIKADANWTNGKPVTSEDVVVTWKMIINPNIPVMSTLGWSDIKTIKVLSSKKFEVVLKQPYAPLLSQTFAAGLPTIMPSSVFKGMTPAQVRSASFNHDPMVTDGPFKFKSWQPGEAITVVRNPHWYGPKAKSKEIVFKVVPDENTLLADAQTGAINVYYFAPIEQTKQLAAIPGGHVYYYQQPGWELLRVNYADKALRNRDVREAIELGIDRAGLVKDVWLGHGNVNSTFQAPDEWDYDASIKPYPNNPAKARQLLKKAGYTMGSNGYFEKNGKVLSFRYVTTSGNPWRAADERLIQAWMKNIGIKLEIHNYTSSALFGTIIPSGKGWDLAEEELNASADPGAGLETFFETGQALNYGGYSDPAFDKVMHAQDSLLTNKQRLPDLHKALSILHTDLAAIWLYNPENIDATVHVAGYDPNPYTSDTWDVWNWRLTK